MHFPKFPAKTFPYFSMVHLLHRLYGVDAPVHTYKQTNAPKYNIRLW